MHMYVTQPPFLLTVDAADPPPHYPSTPTPVLFSSWLLFLMAAYVNDISCFPPDRANLYPWIVAVHSPLVNKVIKIFSVGKVCCALLHHLRL